ncbi:MAG TPA: YCF48-related protein [Candidatus Angelobacter sp.]|nr:YCF48-related protein [Candidatus Angelobacter sp.]
MRRLAAILSISLILAPVYAQNQEPGSRPWPQQDSGTDVQLRGVSAVSHDVAWASGAKGTVLRTVDGGEHWEKVNVPNAEALDFRDVQAFDEKTAFVLSIGPGEQSRIYKTADGGKTWQLQFTNKDPKAFYDCFAFWDSKHGIALSDSVDGKFPLIATSDGASWKAVAVKKMPAALPSEGAFAASGTCIATFGKKDVWFGTGGPAARVFHSHDRGTNWTVAETPILHGEASQGIFSVLFWSEMDGAIVGGDYKEPAKSDKTAAITHDGGKTWTLATQFPGGYRSGLVSLGAGFPVSHLVAVGTSGSDFSVDDGADWASSLGTTPWSRADDNDYNAVSCSTAKCWAVGAKGRIAFFIPDVPDIEY